MNKEKINKLTRQKKELEKRNKELHKLLKPIEDKISSNGEKIDSIQDEIGKILLSETLNWTLLLDCYSGQLVYDKFCEEMRRRNLLTGGIIQETSQNSIKIALIKNNTEFTNKIIDSIKEISPFLKPFKKGAYKGFKFIDIFEHTLYENGVYFILFNDKKNIYKLMKTRRHSTYELKVFNSLEKIMKYIEENHYYNSLEGEGEETC